MILDGKEDKAVGVLLKQRLIGLSGLDSRSNLGGFNRLLDGSIACGVEGRDGHVFFSRGCEV